MVRVRREPCAGPLHVQATHFLPHRPDLDADRMVRLLAHLYRWAGFPQRLLPNGQWRTLGRHEPIDPLQVYRVYVKPHTELDTLRQAQCNFEAAVRQQEHVAQQHVGHQEQQQVDSRKASK